MSSHPRRRRLGRVALGLLVALSPAAGLARPVNCDVSVENGPAPSSFVLGRQRARRRTRRATSRQLTYLAAPARLEDGVGPLIGSVPLAEVPRA